MYQNLKCTCRAILYCLIKLLLSGVVVAKIAIAAPGTPGDFRRDRRIKSTGVSAALSSLISRCNSNENFRFIDEEIGHYETNSKSN